MIFEEHVYQDTQNRNQSYNRIRQEFHRIPELGFQEVKTTKKIIKFLEDLGISPIPFRRSGVMAYIGSENGKTLALRADIDALAVKEETGLSFASEHPGYMHACGHDGHIAGLLGAAEILKENEASLPCRVKLIFQPSEENTQGAKEIIGEGVLEDVDTIFGLHLFSDLPYGIVNAQPGARMAQTDRFTMTFTGKGGHAGKPHLCVDATVMAAEFVMAAQTIVSREVNPVEHAVVTIGSLHSGTQYNIISQVAEISGTCRSFSTQTARILQQGLERKAHAIADSYGGSVEIQYEFGSHPPLVNHTDFSQKVEKVCRVRLGDSKVKEVAPLMLGEDFSCYLDHVAGTFAFVACGKVEGESYPNHHPQFDIEERALSDAVAMYLCAVEAFALES